MAKTELIPLKERLAPYRGRKGYVKESVIRKIVNEFLDTPVLELFEAPSESFTFTDLFETLWKTRHTKPVPDNPTIRSWMPVLEDVLVNLVEPPADRLSIYTSQTSGFYDRLKAMKHPAVVKLMNINYNRLLEPIHPHPIDVYFSNFSMLYSSEFTVNGHTITGKSPDDIFDLSIRELLLRDNDTETVLGDVIRTPIGSNCFYPFRDPGQYLSTCQIGWIISYAGFFKPMLWYINKKGGPNDQDQHKQT